MARRGRNRNANASAGDRLWRSYFHRGGEMPLNGVTIPEHFADIVSRFQEREAIVSLPQSRRLSYCELQNQADMVARALLAHGFGKGSRVGVWSTNNVEWVLLQLATARIGAVLVNVNPAWSTSIRRTGRGSLPTPSSVRKSRPCF
jgi:fatty-acyl-CoA synthase